MRNAHATSRVQAHQVTKANWMARAISRVASATKLPEPFSTESAQSHLRALRTLVQAEAKNGRWPVDFKNIESSSVENLLIQPLSKAWNLEARIIWGLVSFVCTASDPLLSGCDEITSSKDVNYIRLELLNPTRVTVNLFDPLSHIGIQQPQKILARCPSLLLASALPCVTQSDHSNGLIGGLRTTVLLEALDELGTLLGRNDLILLINRYPEVLLRSRQELSEMYEYLTENMGLQSSEMARATQMRAHRHALRKLTGLRLVYCPAWRLPSSKVRARHLLAVFAGCWPPSHSVQSGITGEHRLKKLLTAPARQVCQWLNSVTPKQSTDDFQDSSPCWNTKYPAPVSLTEDDVKAFERLVLQINCGGCHSADRRSVEPSSSLPPNISTYSEYEGTHPESGANSSNE